MVTQDNLSSEKHIDRIIGSTFRMLRNIRMAFHFLDEDMNKIITTMIRLKLEYTEVIWSLHKMKHVLKLERIQRISTEMVPDLEDLTYKERLEEMHSTTLKKEMSELMPHTSKVIIRYVKLKGRRQSKEITARQSMGTERMVSY